MTDLTQLRAELRRCVEEKRPGVTLHADAIPALLDAIDALQAERDELDFLLHEGGTMEAQLSKAESERDEARARVTALEKGLEDGRYMMSEKHLGSYRLIIGFETLAAVQAAMQAIADFRALLNPSKGSAG